MKNKNTKIENYLKLLYIYPISTLESDSPAPADIFSYLQTSKIEQIEKSRFLSFFEHDKSQKCIRLPYIYPVLMF